MRKRLRALAAAIAALALFSAHCPAVTPGDVFFAPFDALYATAVQDAQANLLHLKSPPAAPAIRDIRADNTDLIWSGQPGGSRVQVTTFTKSAYYRNYTPGQTFETAVDLWVIPAPQMYADIKAEDPLGAALAPRLAVSEYLGLPPRTTNDAVLTFWVDPADMLRPAIDPRIDVHDLETSFPVTLQTLPLTPASVLPRDAPGPGQAPAQDYWSWFLGREHSIYTSIGGATPYPWTGLGYTYNWNPAASDVVGGSEFVVPRGSRATFVDLTPVESYFK